MKEQACPEGEARMGWLTNTESAPTLEAGAIFMAENQGEVPKNSQSRPSQNIGERVRTFPPLAKEEEQKLVKSFWEKQVARGKITKEQAEGKIKDGRIPEMAGGAGSDEFVQRVQNLHDSITTQKFKEILTKVAYYPDELLKTLIEPLENSYTEIYRDISNTVQDENERRRQIIVLNSEYENVRDLIVEPLVSQAAGRMTEPQRDKINQIKELENVLKDKATSENDRQRIRGELRGKIKELMEIMPDFADEAIPDEILKAIALDDVTAEEFISNIIVNDLEEEQHQLQGFYGQINFEKFRRLSRSMITGERRDRLLNLIQANSAFHNMNYIIKRNFEQFAGQSESLLPKHFEVLSRIPGVDTIIRLYEELHQEVLARETRITEESFQQIDSLVREEFNRILHSKNPQAKVLTRGISGGDMEAWEVFRALIYGRNFFRIMVRAAEHIALSELPEGGDRMMYVSSPQKNFAQILHNFKFIGFRFKPNEELGGPELLQDTIEYNKKKRQEAGKVRIKTLQGTDIDMREAQQIVAARGVMATWRSAIIILGQIRFTDTTEIGKGKDTNILQFFQDHKEEIAGLEDIPEGERLQATRELFKPLIDQTSIGLGVLVSTGSVPTELKQIFWDKAADLNPLVMASMLARLEVDTEAKNSGTLKVKSLEGILVENNWRSQEEKALVVDGQSKIKLIRNEIKNLQKELDPFILKKQAIDKANENIKDENKKRRLNKSDREKMDSLRRKIDSKRLEFKDVDDKLKSLFNNSKWQDLSKKLVIANELRIKTETERLKDTDRLKEAPKKLDDFLTDLTPEEWKVLNDIRANGKLIASDLANIKQATTWFLNDLPINTLDWIKLGQFYDRQTGDMGQFNAADQAFNKIIGNPYGQPVDEILKHFKEAIDGSANVLGLKSAQENQAPVFRTWIDKIQEKGWFNKQKIYSSVLHAFRQPTSRAQEIVGMNALSVDEDGTFEILQKALPFGIIRQEVKDPLTGKIKWKGKTYKDLEKEFHTAWYWRLWGKARDYGPFFLVAFLISLFKGVTKEK